MTPSPIDRPLSRRALLRGATVAGAGALAAYTVGCGDGDGGASPTATAPAASPTSAPAGTATPSLPTTASWRLIEPEGEVPSARRDNSIVTDGGALYVFGGRGGATNLADLWVYNIRSNSWEERAAEGSPSARFGHNAVWEPISGTMIIFGGQAGLSAFFNDVREYQPSSGKWVDPFTVFDLFDAPAPRYGAADAIDGEGRLVISHGFTNGGRFDDTWPYDPLTIEWEDISPPAARPIERCLTRAVWDSVNERLIMFGGQTDATPFLGDTWALETEGWREIVTEPSPPARNFYAMAFDDAAGLAVLFGGNSAEGELGDVWVFDVREEAWSQIEQSGEALSPRQGHDAAWVPGQGLYVFGGNDGSSDLNDLWLMTLS